MRKCILLSDGANSVQVLKIGRSTVDRSDGTDDSDLYRDCCTIMTMRLGANRGYKVSKEHDEIGYIVCAPDGCARLPWSPDNPAAPAAKPNAGE